MLRPINSKGFSFILIPIVVAVVGVIGVACWVVFNNSYTKPTSGSQSSTQKLPQNSTSQSLENTVDNTPLPNNSSSACSNGRIIIYFNDGVTKARQQQIIHAVGATIYTEYTAFNGYVVNVAKERELEKSQEFAKYSEVKSANPEGCPDPTNSPDAAN